MDGVRVLACAFAVLGTVQAAAAQDTVQVVLDQARVLQLPANVATIVVGNPVIADTSIQNGSLMVVTGKAYGLTNIMLLDSKGNTLAEHQVRVSAPRDGTVTVFRGGERMTYSCSPRCESVAVLGDAEKYFDGLLKQSESRDKQATAGANSGGAAR